MPLDKKSTPSSNKNVSISGDVVDSVVVAGDHNVVTKQTTIIQKFFNIFKSDSETLEQRNRRILLNHVENAWIKGVLDASLHGAALLDLGIKQDPEAVTKYPWAIKKESTDETLPAGTSMLEIFDSIGMGRSLLILGAPGSGKTTMLLELARQLITHAREDVTYPIPMVFNLASWTEKLTLADWLAQELNNLYSVPRKTAPDWVKGDKLLLLLDGLDEVRQESRAKCLEAINAFRKEHGLTSLAVCSRSQDYADLNAKLSFEGAIEVQPLTQKQITEFFNRFGKEMAGIKQVLKKDSALREMAETPLFLSIMVMAYRGTQDVDILSSQDMDTQRKYLFDTYIERMFERPRSKNTFFKKEDVAHWLSWLATKMIEHNQVPYLLEDMQPRWLSQKIQALYRTMVGLTIGLISGLAIWLILGMVFGNIVNDLFGTSGVLIFRLSGGALIGSIFGLIYGPVGGLKKTEMVDTLTWNWKQGRLGLFVGAIIGYIVGLTVGSIIGLLYALYDPYVVSYLVSYRLSSMSLLIWALTSVTPIFWQIGGLIGMVIGSLIKGLSAKPISKVTYPGQRVFLSIKNYFSVVLLTGLIVGLIAGAIEGLSSAQTYRLNYVLSAGLFSGSIFSLIFGLIGVQRLGGLAVIRHYILRFILARNNLLPWRLVPFLDHCVDLIFLRRVGGGYIFVHRLLMEHFAEMYVETPTSKGN